MVDRAHAQRRAQDCVRCEPRGCNTMSGFPSGRRMVAPERAGDNRPSAMGAASTLQMFLEVLTSRSQVLRGATATAAEADICRGLCGSRRELGVISQCGGLVFRIWNRFGTRRAFVDPRMPTAAGYERLTSLASVGHPNRLQKLFDCFVRRFEARSNMSPGFGDRSPSREDCTFHTTRESSWQRTADPAPEVRRYVDGNCRASPGTLLSLYRRTRLAPSQGQPGPFFVGDGSHHSGRGREAS
jgi:hypothetical protein